MFLTFCPWLFFSAVSNSEITFAWDERWGRTEEEYVPTSNIVCVILINFVLSLGCLSPWAVNLGVWDLLPQISYHWNCCLQRTLQNFPFNMTKLGVLLWVSVGGKVSEGKVDDGYSQVLSTHTPTIHSISTWSGSWKFVCSNHGFFSLCSTLLARRWGRGCREPNEKKK